ncbi:hypothetical protein LXM50_02700 [Microbacterium sp. Au-Mic1]|uniref:hypothetical protein n=1 Tax=Microbacterium sp. Au-Mic1 TaxID=2906457 RepID=UPI001E2FD9FB|nr:hypothetical protein [Microbacterium sp. Au-Mic1]MCE4024878.1 hypothetical protein [Microbacterium sp. Au-Mic1]
MEQESIPGQDPLEPPDPRVAQAYLDVLPGLQSRREIVIDRRRLARLAIIEGVALAAYFLVFLTAWMLQRRAGTSTTTPVSAIAVYLTWVSLVPGLRERYGARLALTAGQRTVQVLLIVGALVAFLGIMIVDLAVAPLSPLWAGLPALFAAASGLWAWRILSHAARDQHRRPAPPHAEFTRAGRITTVICGIVLTACIVATGLGAQPRFGTTISAFTCVAATVVVLIGQFSGRATAVGEMWHAPQWTMFAIGAGAAATVVMLLAIAPGAAFPVSIMLGALILVVSIVVSVRPEPTDE